MCIQILSDANNEFECEFCNEKHKPPTEKGFPKSLSLLKLVRAKADQVYRNPNVEQLRLKLAELKKNSDNYKFTIQNGEAQVKEYCVQLRSQVNMEAEVLIEQILKFNATMIGEVNKYEEQCISSFNSKSSDIDAKATEFLAKIETFYTESALLKESLEFLNLSLEFTEI